jgi:hypothetical protein
LLPHDLLPTYGLATWYLHSTAIRVSNQCLIASGVISLALQDLDIPARCVSLGLSLPWAHAGRGVRYGGVDPALHGDQVTGHIGVVTNELLIDATALQFVQIRESWGPLPLMAVLTKDPALLLQEGETVAIPLTAGKDATYEVLPGRGASDLVASWAHIGADEVAVSVSNLFVGYAAALAVAVPEATLNRLRHDQTHPGLLALVDDIRRQGSPACRSA